MTQDTRDEVACLIIDGLGGTSKVAAFFEIDPGAVSQWKKRGMPKHRVKFLRLARADFDWSRVPPDYPVEIPRPACSVKDPSFAKEGV